MSNLSIFHTINSIAGRSYAFDQLIIFLSNWFGYVLLAGLLVFFVLRIYKRQNPRNISGTLPPIRYYSTVLEEGWSIFVVLVAAITAYATAVAIKEMVVSPRPFEVLSNAHVLYTHGGGDSFPSGHATFYMALAVSLFFYHRRIALVYFLGALIIGLARIAVGVHWPLDIFGGWVLGGSIGVASHYFLSYAQGMIYGQSSS